MAEQAGKGNSLEDEANPDLRLEWGLKPLTSIEEREIRARAGESIEEAEGFWRRKEGSLAVKVAQEKAIVRLRNWSNFVKDPFKLAVSVVHWEKT